MPDLLRRSVTRLGLLVDRLAPTGPVLVGGDFNVHFKSGRYPRDILDARAAWCRRTTPWAPTSRPVTTTAPPSTTSSTAAASVLARRQPLPGRAQVRPRRGRRRALLGERPPASRVVANDPRGNRPASGAALTAPAAGIRVGQAGLDRQGGDVPASISPSWSASSSAPSKRGVHVRRRHGRRARRPARAAAGRSSPRTAAPAAGCTGAPRRAERSGRCRHRRDVHDGRATRRAVGRSGTTRTATSGPALVAMASRVRVSTGSGRAS